MPLQKNERSKLTDQLLTYYIQHYDELILSAFRLTRNYEDAEDVMQNVAIALFKRKADLDHVENCGAFIAVCIRRTAINLFRHKARERATDPYYLETYRESVVIQEANTNDPEYDYLEWVESLESHLQSYSKEMRNAFIAHYIDNVPLHTLSVSLGLSVKALSGRFARMRKTLRKNARSLFDQFNVLMQHS